MSAEQPLGFLLFGKNSLDSSGTQKRPVSRFT
jgi:hypothetical protein